MSKFNFLEILSFSLFTIISLNYTVYGGILKIDKHNYEEFDFSNCLFSAVDTHSVWSLDQVKHIDLEWQGVGSNLLSGGFNTYTHWYKIEIENHSEDQYLVLGEDPLIYELDVYFVNDIGLIRQSNTGASLLFEKRELKTNEYCFLLPKGTFVCYIKLRKKNNFQILTKIASYEDIVERDKKRSMLFSLSLGAFLVLIAYNLFIFFFINERVYLYYVIYLCSVIFYNATSKGFFFEHLWSSTPYFNYFIASSAALNIVTMSFFVMSLLETRTYLPNLTKGLYLFMSIAILDMVINFFSLTISSGIIQFSGTIFCFYLIIIGIQSYRKDVKVAKYFLQAWTLYLLCIIIYVGQRNGFIPPNSFTQNAILYGSTSEAILLSLVLAYRIKILRREKEDAQQREIQEREDKRLYLKEQAHEIKNPIHFVGNYVEVLARNLGYFSDLLGHYKELGQKGVDFKKKQKEITEFEDSIKIKLIKNELMDGVNSVKIAFSRIKEIANNFDLNFESNELIDVNKCVRDTLLIVKKDLREGIEIKNKLGDVPRIKSYKGRLNQVFLNFFKNAIEAIEQKPFIKNEFILIETRYNMGNVIITIKDTGIGMSKEVQNKLFDKYYSTKSKSQGRGLGLFVCKKIINEHNGRIYFNSTIKNGTEFMIIIPHY